MFELDRLDDPFRLVFKLRSFFFIAVDVKENIGETGASQKTSSRRGHDLLMIFLEFLEAVLHHSRRKQS